MCLCWVLAGGCGGCRLFSSRKLKELKKKKKPCCGNETIIATLNTFNCHCFSGKEMSGSFSLWSTSVFPWRYLLLFSQKRKKATAMKHSKGNQIFWGRLETAGTPITHCGTIVCKRLSQWQQLVRLAPSHTATFRVFWFLSWNQHFDFSFKLDIYFCCTINETKWSMSTFSKILIHHWNKIY